MSISRNVSMHSNVKQDLDKLKQEIERMGQAEAEMKSPGEVPIKSSGDFEQATKQCKEQIESLQRNIEYIERCKDFYDKMLFKAGDAAFHKTFGNVLIKGILLNQTNLEESRYMIITQNAQMKVAASELVPISEATRVLFGKK